MIFSTMKCTKCFSFQLSKATEDLRKLEDLEELVWDPNNGLSDKEIDQFQIVARFVLLFVG